MPSLAQYSLILPLLAMLAMPATATPAQVIIIPRDPKAKSLAEIHIGGVNIDETVHKLVFEVDDKDPKGPFRLVYWQNLLNGHEGASETWEGGAGAFGVSTYGPKGSPAVGPFPNPTRPYVVGRPSAEAQRPWPETTLTHAVPPRAQHRPLYRPHIPPSSQERYLSE